MVLTFIEFATIIASLILFGTDPDRNRFTWETPSSEAIPFRRKPLRRMRLLRDPAQTQVWSEQVWLNTTFISQGSWSWDKLDVDKINNNYNTSYNHYYNTNLKPKVKTIAPKILAHTQMHK